MEDGADRTNGGVGRRAQDARAPELRENARKQMAPPSDAIRHP
jgi:hypothetical protein